MSQLSRSGLLDRLRHYARRRPEPGVRAHIADLVQEAAEAEAVPGGTGELDRQERALIANVLGCATPRRSM